jgi:DNA-directed RNA polymerase I subunit RPA2
MIINKASYERGFAHGSVYKSEFIQLKSVSCKSAESRNFDIFIIFEREIS